MTQGYLALQGIDLLYARSQVDIDALLPWNSMAIEMLIVRARAGVRTVYNVRRSIAFNW